MQSASYPGLVESHASHIKERLVKRCLKSVDWLIVLAVSAALSAAFKLPHHWDAVNEEESYIFAPHVAYR
jgi:hypothetical protein